ncbi:MAG: L,D-transpeptidase family protein [Syntrophorhabdales bacterium]|jgi:murein L,D-transpeptidase YafK
MNRTCRHVLLPFVLFCLVIIMSFPSAAEEPAHLKADRVIVLKSKKIMMLMKGSEVLKQYEIALGENPQGHKVRAGDSRTPEGDYVLDGRNPKSRFHRSIHISYPNGKDMLNAAMLGVPPGGNIMIHGLPNGMGWVGELHALLNWTDGCIAVTNEEMDEIWESVPDGTPIRIEF